MKTKSVQRTKNAYNRLKKQIGDKRYSSEFKARIAEFEKPDKERAQDIYWKKKVKELKTLEAKLQGYI